MSRPLRAVPDSEAPRSSWEQLLLASVRAEFRGEVIVASEGSPLLGAGCAVAGCTGYGYHRPWGRGTGRALCALHGQEWQRQGSPEIDACWVAAAKPLRALRPLRTCAIPGCRRSAKSWGRCASHRSRLEGASR
jgi:hypothetical protein